MKVEDLGLTGFALTAAQEFATFFPEAIFTSGRRSKVDQARAVAQDVLLDRDFIKKTYRDGVVCREAQAWVENATAPLTLERIEAGLLEVFQSCSDIDLSHFSKHLGGMAFDVHPVTTADGDAMKLMLYALATQYGGKFLEREGKLIRWHWEATA